MTAPKITLTASDTGEAADTAPCASCHGFGYYLMEPDEDGNQQKIVCRQCSAPDPLQIRRDAFEECAQIADGWDFGAPIARDIRALIDKEPSV